MFGSKLKVLMYAKKDWVDKSFLQVWHRLYQAVMKAQPRAGVITMHVHEMPHNTGQGQGQRLVPTLRCIFSNVTDCRSWAVLPDRAAHLTSGEVLLLKGFERQVSACASLNHLDFQ